MKKLTLDDLRKLRDEQKNAMNKRETDDKEIEIIIGMGT
jgi:NADP-reducing hydrogenase subunit HndB